jgi:hypothetical protein
MSDKHGGTNPAQQRSAGRLHKLLALGICQRSDLTRVELVEHRIAGMSFSGTARPLHMEPCLRPPGFVLGGGEQIFDQTDGQRLQLTVQPGLPSRATARRLIDDADPPATFGEPQRPALPPIRSGDPSGRRLRCAVDEHQRTGMSDICGDQHLDIHLPT